MFRTITKDLYLRLVPFLPKVIRQKIERGGSLIITRGSLIAKHAQLSVKPVYYRSSSVNIYHCCVQRTASQWMKKILSDTRIYQYSGLKPYDVGLTGVDMRNYEHRVFQRAFPRRTIVPALYIGFHNFSRMPKPGHYKAFFVMRDPRDIVISSYFSSKVSHVPMGNILQRRKVLNSLSQEEGIMYMINYHQEFGLFDALRSWSEVPKNHPDVLKVRYEDLIGSHQYQMFQEIFKHCDIRIPDHVLKGLLQDYSFKRLSGRKTGEEDKKSHYRKGRPGDWQNYFSNRIYSIFKDVTGDLTERLGYG